MKPQDANKAVKAEIGTVFSHVLENAGVFNRRRRSGRLCQVHAERGL
ncbi:MAG: hypothetical protein ACLRNA_06280 [Gemmiger formicilis]